MTPEEIQAHAAGVQANNYAVPASIAAPVDAPIAPASAPVVANDMPSMFPVAPVPDGSQPPIPVTNAVPGQRVQTAAAFNVGPPEITAGDLAGEGDKTANEMLLRSDAAAKAQKDAIAEQAKVDADIAEAQKPIEEDRQRDLAQQVADHEDAEMEAQENAKKHFDVLMNYNQEIQDHIANQPTDLWGRAGVNKVAGIIGLVLGGLGGGATGGKNLVVDTLNSLVEQNLKQNEYKYEMLKGKVTTENQAYAQVRATSQDKQEAADRYKLLALEQYKQQLTQAAGQFAAPQAKARADAAVAQIDAQKVDLENKIYNERLNNHRAAAQIGLATREQNLRSIELQDARDARGSGNALVSEIPGFDRPGGVKLPDATVEKLQASQAGAVQVTDALTDAIKNSDESGLRAVIENKALGAAVKTGLIKQLNLSNRVSKDEGAILDAMVGPLATGNAADVLNFFGAKTYKQALENARTRFASMHIQHLNQAYGFVPNKTNYFLNPAGFDVNGNPVRPSAASNAGESNDPLSAMKSRNEIAQETARAATQQQIAAAHAQRVQEQADFRARYGE